jgi:signal transduction histidine kinase
MMIRIFWLMRITGFAAIGLTALVSPPRSPVQQATQIACFAAVGVCLIVWWFAPRKLLPAVFIVMAVAGGVAGATSGSGQSLIAFACVAAGWAGSETDTTTTMAVATGGIVAGWIAGAFTGSSVGTMLGEPAIIVVATLFGLNRRSFRAQAEQAAALLAEHERLTAEQRRGDVLDERARIAREIHDVLAHSLGALGIQIQAAKAILTDHGDVDRAVDALSTAQRMAADGLTETRRAVHALRVDTLPLADELAVVTETHRQRYHVPVTLTTAGTPRPLPPDAALALLRAAQEALVNAAKHAPGQPIAVRLSYEADDVALSVVNGLDAAQPPGPGGGYGLTGMRERLRLLNGTLLAGPESNEWAVTAVVPASASASACTSTSTSAGTGAGADSGAARIAG